MNQEERSSDGRDLADQEIPDRATAKWLSDKYAGFDTPTFWLVAGLLAAFATEEVGLERERCAKAVCADCRVGISLITSGETELYRHYIEGSKSETILTSYCAAKPIWELARDGR